MTALEEKRVDWLYGHFQAISSAGHRYLVLFTTVCVFALVVTVSAEDAFKIPAIELSVHRELVVAGCVVVGAFLFIGYTGSYDKGEATIQQLCEALKCGYDQLEFIDTHPTLIDFVKYRRALDRAKRSKVARITVALLYPFLLLSGLAFLAVLWAVQARGLTLRTVDDVLQLVALPVLWVAVDRAIPFFGRRWRTFRQAEQEQAEKDHKSVAA